MDNLNWVDLIILVMLFFSIIAGINRGFVKEIVSLGALVLAVIVASVFANPIANLFTGSPAVQQAVHSASSTISLNIAKPISYMAIGISFVILFSLTIFAGSLISSIITAMIAGTSLSLGNRLLGALFGLGRGVLIVVVIMFVLQLTPVFNASWWRQSQFVIAFQPAVQWLARFVSPALADLKSRLGTTLQGVNEQLQQTANSVSGLLR